MKSEELMIGDWVKCYSSNCGGHRVDFINEMDDEIGIDGEIFDLNRVKPIPLTPEILEKNGFERISKSPYKTEYRLCFNEDNNDFLFVYIHHLRDYVTVYYNPLTRMVHLDCNIENCMVHELQHALRLAKINKEIEL